MKCILLAAGYATRLYPLTKNFPKPLLKVGEKTILDWLIDDVSSSGKIDEYIVISNHKFATHFLSWSKTRNENITVVDDNTSSNETRLGAVRDIQFAIDALGIDDDMLILAGDNILDFSLNKFIDYSLKKQTSCIMRYFEADNEVLKKCGVVLTDENDLILRMEEKPQNPFSNWCCPPFYYYTREAARLIKKGIEEGCGTDAPGSFIAYLASNVPVHAMEMPGKRYDIGDIASYEKVKNEYRGIM